MASKEQKTSKKTSKPKPKPAARPKVPFITPKVGVTKFDCLECGKEFSVIDRELEEGNLVDCPVCGAVLKLLKKDDKWLVSLGDQRLAAESSYDFDE